MNVLRGLAEKPESLEHPLKKLKIRRSLMLIALTHPPLIKRFIANRIAGKRALFFPHEAYEPYMMYKICFLLGYRTTDDLSIRCDLSFFWRTVHAEAVRECPEAISHGLNAGCTDITKEAVEKAFRAAFGYGTFVDPLTHQGSLVEKSNDNGLHDGVVLNGPIRAKKPSRVYQKLVDAEIRDGVIEEFRLPFIGNSIPLAYRKLKPVSGRFAIPAVSKVIETHEALSDDETAKVLQVARAMRLDCGEVDVLRDRNGGRLYLIDVNSTPYGPPRGIPPFEWRKALIRMTKAFQKEFLT